MKLSLLLLSVACSRLVESASSTQRQSVIIDTDIFGDVDDIGALTVANVLHNCGLADVKGIAIDTASKYGALAANVSSFPPPHFQRLGLPSIFTHVYD